jgi:hypothetical protein
MRNELSIINPLGYDPPAQSKIFEALTIHELYSPSSSQAGTSFSDGWSDLTSRQSSVETSHSSPGSSRNVRLATQDSIFRLEALERRVVDPTFDNPRSLGPSPALLKRPSFAMGIEIVEEHVEKNYSNDSQGHSTPTKGKEVLRDDIPRPDVASNRRLMRHDSSFYKFGGFCDCAKALVKGETGFKIVKRPSVSDNLVVQ